MATVESFASRLRRTREERGLSQDALARKAEVSKNTVARWEAGSVPEAPTLVRIADLLEVSVRWLIVGDEDADGAAAGVAKVATGTRR